MVDKTYKELLDELETYNQRTAAATDTYEASLGSIVDAVTQTSDARDEAVVASNNVKNAEERAIGTGVSIYRGTGVSAQGNYVQNGDVVPAVPDVEFPITHLAVVINGKVEDVAMSPIASGAVSLLTETSATIGVTPVNFVPVGDFQLAALSKYNSITEALLVKYGAYIDVDTTLQSVTPKVNSRFIGDNGAVVTVASGQSVFTGNSTSDDFKYAEISGIRAEGQGKVADGTKFISFNGDANKVYNLFKNLRLSGFDTCIERSAGWGNVFMGVDHRGSKTGVKYVGSPLLAGWSSSGDVSLACSYQYNDIGIDETGIPWCNTYIDSVIEGNGVGAIINGANSVLINPWFEGNVKNLDIKRGFVLLGSRGASWSASDINLSVSDECVTKIERNGIFQTRGAFSEAGDGYTFWSDGSGVRKLRGALHSQTTQDSNLFKIDSRVFTSSGEVKGLTLDLFGAYSSARLGDLDDRTNEARIATLEARALRGTSGTGTAAGKFMFEISKFENTGLAYNDRHEVLGVDFDKVYAGTDGAIDLGSASFRFNDSFFVNAPTVGSDVNIKDNIRKIPQELCDFALEVENKGYTLKINQSGREHFGIVIDSTLLDSISNIIDLDKFAPFCKTEFKDEAGNPTYKNLWGKKVSVEGVLSEDGTKLTYEMPDNSEWFINDEPAKDRVIVVDVPELSKDKEWSRPKVEAIVGGVRLQSFWQVRYQEWQTIVNEAQRRKIKDLSNEVEIIKKHLGL